MASRSPGGCPCGASAAAHGDSPRPDQRSGTSAATQWATHLGAAAPTNGVATARSTGNPNDGSTGAAGPHSGPHSIALSEAQSQEEHTATSCYFDNLLSTTLNSSTQKQLKSYLVRFAGQGVPPPPRHPHIRPTQKRAAPPKPQRRTNSKAQRTSYLLNKVKGLRNPQSTYQIRQDVCGRAISSEVKHFRK